MNYLLCAIWKYLFGLVNPFLKKWLKRQLGKIKPAVEFKQLSVKMNCLNHFHGSLILGTLKEL